MLSTDLVPILWNLGILALVAVVWFISTTEFNTLFSYSLHRLYPSHWKDPDYIELLSQVLSEKQIYATRRQYVFWSSLLVVTLGGMAACLKPAKLLIQKSFPPIVYDTLEKGANDSRYESVFIYMFFFAVFLHLPPILALFTQNRRRNAESLKNEGGAIAKFLMRLFAFQQYILYRSVHSLVQYKAEYENIPTSGRRPRMADSGVVSELVKQHVAAAIMKSTTDERILEEYCRIETPKFEVPLGKGVSQIPGTRQNSPGSHPMMLSIIEMYGIPYTVARFEWKPRRSGNRTLLNARVEGVIQGQAVKDVWIENVGEFKHRKGRWNSLLVRVTDGCVGSLADEMKKATLTLLKASHVDLSKKPLAFKVTRHDFSGDGAELYLGCVVQDCDIARFSRLVKRLQAK